MKKTFTTKNIVEGISFSVIGALMVGALTYMIIKALIDNDNIENSVDELSAPPVDSDKHDSALQDLVVRWE
jgi:hypothetical protein